ncbi:MAG: peptidase M48 [Deltaproteobacteria bacterium]|nr:peptidase M48 [Deltaproteobacteria bacterium]
MKRRLLCLYLFLPFLISLAGCQSMPLDKKTLGDTTSKIGELGQSGAQAVKEAGKEKGRTTKESFDKTKGAVQKSFQDFTPEQEYYIGRSVAAVILSKYPPYWNPRANDYLNLLGQTLAQVSDMPEIFRGYRFLVLDSGEINAFATPGGHVFITRGLLRCCLNEDAVAAILAHEIAHIHLRHGIQAIKKSRITDAVSIMATESVKVLSPVEAGKLTETFGGVVSDISNTINNGYSRSFEYEADAAARKILQRLGYDPNGLVEMLQVMEKTLKPGETGFAKTHPSPKDRIDNLLGKNKNFSPVQKPEKRQARFLKTFGDI